ncbi:LysR family transcriptional regulator [Kocuria soli]|nr:LysR family transcriptional regulator [Kocuria soli]
MIDPRLELLRAVDEHGTVTGAAEAMSRSPSGVSRQLRELARELGVALFDHVGRRVQLTEAGRTLVQHAHQLAEQAERALAAVRTTTDEISGQVVVAGHITALGSLIAPSIGRLHSRHSALRVIAEERQPREAIPGLLSAAIDLAVMPVTAEAPAVTDPRCAVLDIGVEPIDLLVSQTHRLVGADEIALIEAAAEEWILGSREHDSRTETLSACHRAGFNPRPAHYAQDWSAVAALVAANLGVALVPRSVPTQWYPGTSRVFLGGHAPPMRRIIACTRAGAEDTPALGVVVDELRDLARAWTSNQDPEMDIDMP